MNQNLVSIQEEVKNPFLNENESILESFFHQSSYRGRSQYFYDILHQGNSFKKIICEFRLWNDSESMKRYNCFEVLGFTKSGRIKLKITHEGVTTEGKSFHYSMEKTITHNSALNSIIEFSQLSGIYSIVK